MGKCEFWLTSDLQCGMDTETDEKKQCPLHEMKTVNVANLARVQYYVAKSPELMSRVV